MFQELFFVVTTITGAVLTYGVSTFYKNPQYKPPYEEIEITEIDFIDLWSDV